MTGCMSVAMWPPTVRRNLFAVLRGRALDVFAVPPPPRGARRARLTAPTLRSIRSNHVRRQRLMRHRPCELKVRHVGLQ